MTGVIYIGRIYYKGIVTSQTQDTTRTITRQISDTFQFGGLDAVTLPESHAFSAGAGDYTVYAQCLGNYRYSYIIDSQVKGQNSLTPLTTKHALWLDLKKEGAACAPLDLTQDNPSTQTAAAAGGDTVDNSPNAVSLRRELIPNNMRMKAFKIEQPSGRSFVNINIKVIFGDHDLSPGGRCVPNIAGGQFCAVSELNTTVKKRL